MKASVKFFILFIAFCAGTWMASPKVSAQVSVSFQVFYDDLSPHGNWVDYADYGYVWVPNVSHSFTPYGSNGHWVFTNYGWTWVSNYSWGWAPFHYGRWFSDPMYGYMWVPGNEWGPGWVSWRQSEGYYGWAPIGPGISIELAYSSGYNVPSNQWVFVGARDFGRTNINNYYVDRSNNTTIINNTTVINNVQSDGAAGARYNAGPDRGQVQSRTGNVIKPVALRESNKPGQRMSNGELQTYRPRVERGTAKPSKVADIKDVKPASQRSEGAQLKERQPGKEQSQRQRKEQPDKQQPAQQQQKEQPKRERPAQEQRKEQPDKQQAPQQQQRNQPNKEQQGQPKREAQPDKQQAPQEHQRTQPNREQPAQPKREAQPDKQQAPQQQPRSQPNREQPSQQPQRDQPAKQQRPQQQQRSQPNRAQPSQQPRNEQPKQQADPRQNNNKEEKHTPR